VHVTGLTHDEKGYPVATDPEVQARLVRRLCDKILVHEPELRDIEEFEMDDADVAVISYGISARPSKAAVKEARKRGHKVGFIQLRTIWPFPEAYFQEIAERVKTFIVVEINYGQLKLEVDRVVGRERVHLLPKLGGDIHRPEDVYRKIREVYHGA